MTGERSILIASPAGKLAELAARRFVAAVGEALEARGRAWLALAGGQTPRALYRTLAAPDFRSRLDWTRVEFFWGDERCVMPESADSNYRMARDSLLAELSLRPDQVHRVPAQTDSPEEGAARYEAELSHSFGLTPGAGRRPRFDLILLGVGADGHTASLFPGGSALEEWERWTAVARPAGLVPRITLTLPVLNAARQVHFLVAGEEKADAVRRALQPGEKETVDSPAGRVRPAEGQTLWIMDVAAASLLDAL